MHFTLANDFNCMTYVFCSSVPIITRTQNGCSAGNFMSDPRKWGTSTPGHVSSNTLSVSLSVSVCKMNGACKLQPPSLSSVVTATEVRRCSHHDSWFMTNFRTDHLLVTANEYICIYLGGGNPCSAWPISSSWCIRYIHFSCRLVIILVSSSVSRAATSFSLLSHRFFRLTLRCRRCNVRWRRKYDGFHQE